MNKSEILTFRVSPLDSVRIRGLAVMNGYTLSGLCRGALYQALQDAKKHEGVIPYELPVVGGELSVVGVEHENRV